MSIELFNEGLRYQQSGDLARAEHCYRQALVINPQFVDALGNLGIVLKAQGQRVEASACFRRALEFNPNYYLALNNLAILHAEAGQLNEAEAWFREIIRRYPGQASAHYNLGNLLLERRQLEEAIFCFSQAVRLNPNYADAYCNLGNCYKDQGHLSEAAQCYRAALGIKPNDAECHGNLANVLKDQGLLAEAASEYEQALHYEPNHANVRLNRALLWLLQGEFACGWTDYEFRWHAHGTPPRQFVQPVWDGTPLHGKTILVYAEQGLGDTIQFVRFTHLVKERGGRVVVECQPALVNLLKSVVGIEQVFAQGQALPPFDVQIPLMSLGRIFQPTLDTLPGKVPYIHADPARVLHWQDEIRRAARRQPAGSSTPFKIGVVWQGNPNQLDDRHRSVLLAQFAPLAAVQGVRLLSLQVGPGIDQLKHVSFPIIDVGGRFDPNTLDDLAAVLVNLDLVVTVCTSVAHLAGAMGVPGMVALKLVPYWCWHLDWGASSWYPSLRLFRQKSLGDWRPVFESIAAEIAAKLTRSI